MRYFTASPQLLNAMRLQVMSMLAQPNAKAEQPWPADINALALSPHEYEPPQYAGMIEYALANGAQEITRQAYDSLMPKPVLPPHE